MASPAAPTGAERSLAILAAGLAGKGWDVHLVVPGPWALAKDVDAAGVQVSTVPTRACWAVWYQRRWGGPLFLARRGLALIAGGRQRLERELRRMAPDVVHVNCLPHLAGARAAQRLGLPVVWHLREILPPGPRRRWFARQLALCAQEIVAVSEAVGTWVREERLGDRLHVIPNGVRPPAPGPGRLLSRAKLELPPDGVLVVWLGQLVPHKGADAFIAAARRALADEGSLRFALAGPGPDRYRLTLAQAIQSGAGAERIHLLPPQSSPGPLLEAADIVSLTTLTPDPLPRAVLEGMSWGRPVAAFASGGTGEMVIPGETGLLTPIGDLDGLARCFVDLARDPARREAMGEAGAARAREWFSIERHVERMAAILSQAAVRTRGTESR